MRYELLLQTGVPGTPLDVPKLEAALIQRGATALEDGCWAWKVGRATVDVHPLKEAGELKAMELRLQLTEDLEPIRELVREGAALAADAGVKLYDPQLSRTLSANDEGLVADQYQRTAKYAGEMMGVPEAVIASFAPAEEGLKPGTKVLLGLAAFFVVLYLVFDWLLVA